MNIVEFYNYEKNAKFKEALNQGGGFILGLEFYF